MSYIKRVQKSIDFIETNIKEEIRLPHVAQSAAFSPYHFHRIFTLIVGDGIKNYIRKRRLTEAAYELRNSDKRILEIALDYQFESQESFTRAFKKMFSMTPGKYRKSTVIPKFYKQKHLTKEVLMHRAKGIKIQPNIISKDPFLVIGLEYKGPQKPQGDLWEQFIPRIKEIKNKLDNMTSYGVCYANAEMIQNGELTYMASVPVINTKNIPKGMISRKIEGGDFVKVTHKGSLSKILETIDFIYGTWFPKSGYDPDDRADLELYDERLKEGQEDSEFDILVPIKKSVSIS